MCRVLLQRIHCRECRKHGRVGQVILSCRWSLSKLNPLRQQRQLPPLFPRHIEREWLTEPATPILFDLHKYMDCLRQERDSVSDGSDDSGRMYDTTTGTSTKTYGGTSRRSATPMTTTSSTHTTGTAMSSTRRDHVYRSRQHRWYFHSYFCDQHPYGYPRELRIGVCCDNKQGHLRDRRRRKWHNRSQISAWVRSR